MNFTSFIKKMSNQLFTHTHIYILYYICTHTHTKPEISEQCVLNVHYFIRNTHSTQCFKVFLTLIILFDMSQIQLSSFKYSNQTLIIIFDINHLLAYLNIFKYCYLIAVILFSRYFHKMRIICTELRGFK